MTAVVVTIMVVLYSFQSLFCKLFSQHYQSEDASLTSTIFSICYGVFAGVVTLLIARLHVAPSGYTWLFGGLNAVMLLLYNMSMIQASRTGSYSFQMISSLFGGILVPMLWGVVFGGKAFTAIQLVAIVMMLASFVLMNLKGLSLKGNAKMFYFWCATLFLSNGMYSVFLNQQTTVMAGGERNEMIIITFLGMAILHVLLQFARDPSALKTGFKMSKKALIFLLICCASASAAVHLVLYVLTLFENETILFTIDNGGVLLLSVLYSLVLFHEKPTLPQIAGMALAGASIVMLSL